MVALLYGQVEGGEGKRGRNCAAHERPVAQASGALPGAGGDDGLRSLASQKVGPNEDGPAGPLGFRPGPLMLRADTVNVDIEFERGTVVEVPDLDTISHPVPGGVFAASQKEVDGR
jgi:hypothetical protein